MKKHCKIMKIDINRLPLYLYGLCIISECLWFSISRIIFIGFSPVNGDFQNYNPMRRLLDGQVPFVDFPPYIGLGVLALNTPLLAIGGGSFTASLFVTNLTALLCFILMTFLICFLGTEDKQLAFFASASMPLLSRLCRNLNYEWYEWLQFAELTTPGSSMRVERAVLPFLLVTILLITLRLKRQNIFSLPQSKFAISLIGFFTGFFILWSNDFGFAFIPSCSLTLLILFIYNKVKISKMLLYAVLFLLTVFFGTAVSMLTFTVGNPMAYIQMAMGVADYQFWYYGIFHNKIFTFSALLAKTLPYYIPIIIVLALKIHKKKLTQNDILLFCINTTVFFACTLYLYGSGHNTLQIFQYYCSILTVFCWILKIVKTHFALKLSKIVKSKLNFPKAFTIVSCGILFLIFIISISRPLLLIHRKAHLQGDVPYVSELMGHTDLGVQLYAIKDFIGNTKIFSDFSTAIEAMTDQFQPSGTDYIIHVLGDKQRESYIQTFLEGVHNFTLTTAVTIDSPFIIRANWFWYRELLSFYKPVTSAGTTWQHTIWQQTTEPQWTNANDVKVISTKLDDQSMELMLIYNDIEKDYVADVIIKYNANYSMPYFKRLNVMHKIVKIEDQSIKNEFLYLIEAKEISVAQTKFLYDSYFISGNRTEWNLPIFIRGGIGKIILSSQPEEFTTLDIFNIEVIRLLPDLLSFKFELR